MLQKVVRIVKDNWVFIVIAIVVAVVLAMAVRKEKYVAGCSTCSEQDAGVLPQSVFTMKQIMDLDKEIAGCSTCEAGDAGVLEIRGPLDQPKDRRRMRLHHQLARHMNRIGRPQHFRFRRKLHLRSCRREVEHTADRLLVPDPVKHQQPVLRLHDPERARRQRAARFPERDKLAHRV